METQIDLSIFTRITKQICVSTFVSLFLIILFVISPLSTFIKTSMFMKLGVVLLLVYTIQLNIRQTNLLRIAGSSDKYTHVKSNVDVNILCSYIFTLFLGMLAIFVIKSFF